jgi:hypothetical protein
MNTERIALIALFAMQPVVTARGGELSAAPAQPILAMNPLEAMDEGWFTGPLVAPNPTCRPRALLCGTLFHRFDQVWRL